MGVAEAYRDDAVVDGLELRRAMPSVYACAGPVSNSRETPQSRLCCCWEDAKLVCDWKMALLRWRRKAMKEAQS